MKRQDLDALHQKDIAALQAQVKELEQQLVQQRLERSLGTQKNLKQLKTIRHDIARIKTIMHAKGLTASQQKQAE